MIRVMIVDDQAMVRVGFRMILESEDDITVVGEAVDGIDAVEMAERAKPDVVLMDVRMPRLDGIAATEQIVRRGTEERPHPGVLMLTTFDMDEYVYAALRAGASGFLLKDAPPDQLIEAIRVVARGDALLAPSVTRRVIEEFSRQTPTARLNDVVPGMSDLTERELEVLKLVARGLSNSEIAEAMFLGEATVKTHLGRVLNKLDLRDRVQVVVLAYESGLVTPGTP
jgi:DNA-binding NarL/FixJ family response regulator